jgi:hypothetical protein
MKDIIKALTKRATDSAGIQAELDTLETRKANAERERSDTMQALEEARQARRDVMSADEQTIQAASFKVNELTQKVAALESLIEDASLAIESQLERLREAKGREDREAKIAELEAVDGKVEAQTAELAKAVAAVGRIARKMISDIPEEMGIFPLGYYERPQPGERNRPEASSVFASGREAVAAVIADGLCNVIPEIFDGFSDGHYGYRSALFRVMTPSEARPSFAGKQPSSPLPTEKAVKALISDRLRGRAASIKAGDATVETCSVTRSILSRPSEKTTIELVATSWFAMVLPTDNGAGIKKIISAGRRESFAVEHAPKLCATGKFLVADSKEGQAFVEKHRELVESGKSRRPGGGFGTSFADVDYAGDPLGLLEAEQEEAARAVG